MDKLLETETVYSTTSDIITIESQISQIHKERDNMHIKKHFRTHSIDRKKVLSDYFTFANSEVEYEIKEEDIIEYETNEISIKAVQINKCKKYSEYFNNENNSNNIAIGILLLVLLISY